MKKTFDLFCVGKGKIVTKVYYPKRLPKDLPRYDIIRLILRNKKGSLMDIYLYPEETICISTALLNAYVECMQKGLSRISPKEKNK